MILQANTEIETLDHKHKALSKKHDKLVEEMDEQKEKHKKALAKAKAKMEGLRVEVAELNRGSALLETRIRQLKQKVRFAELGVSEDAGKENSLVLSNSMGNNVMMSGAVPKQTMDSRRFGMPAQQFGFTTPTNTVGARNGFTKEMQQMAAMMQQHQQQQQQQQMRRPKASSSGGNMQMFQQYLKFQQMQQQFPGFQ